MPLQIGKLVLAAAAVCFFAAVPSCVNAAAGAGTPKAPVHIYYSDPINGSMDGDGSQAKPWGSLSAIVNAGLINGQDTTSGKVHAGDLIYLKTGNHGAVSLWTAGNRKFANTDFITIQALPGNQPLIESLYLLFSSKWVFRGITFNNPVNYVQVKDHKLADIEHCNNIIFDANILQSSPYFLRWSPTDWENLSAAWAIFCNGSTNCTISNNLIKAVENGIFLDGDSLLCTGNKIDYFANDGIDFTAHNTVISLNRITNHYGLWETGLHPDAMQGWVAWYDTFVENVTIDKNTIINSTGAYSTVPPIPTGIGDDAMQGISIFTGDWRNITVTNNVVVASSWTGISLFGITGGLVANNTVIQQGQYKVWLGIFPRDNGTPSSNVVVRNNIANDYNLPATGVTADHNLTFNKRTYPAWQSNIPAADPTTVFVKYDPTRASYDFNLKTGSPAIGAGSSLMCPPKDIVNRLRNMSKVDLGAYMYTGQ